MRINKLRSLFRARIYSAGLLPALVLTLFTYARPGNAANSNYNSVLIGDQAAGMGGSAISVSQDASAGAWYNPATLGALKGEAFSASVGIYKKFDTSFGSSADLVTAAMRANQGFFQAIPSSTGSVVRPKNMPWLQDWTMTLSILVPEYDSFRGDVNNKGSDISTLALNDQTLWVGVAASRSISANEYFGITGYYTSRSMTMAISERSYVSSTDFEIYTEERNIKQNSIVVLLGYLKKFEDWNLGLSVRLPNLPIAGAGTYSESRILNGAVDPPKDYADVKSHARIPARLGVGFSYSGWSDWLWAFDATWYSPESYLDMDLDNVGMRIRHQPVMNFSLGAEFSGLPWFRVRGGIFTNYSSHPMPDPATVHSVTDRVDQLGFSANAVFPAGKIEYTFGGYYTGGHGQSVQRFNRQFGVIDKSQNIFTMLIGTAYAF